MGTLSKASLYKNSYKLRVIFINKNSEPQYTHVTVEYTYGVRSGRKTILINYSQKPRITSLLCGTLRPHDDIAISLR